MLHTKFRENQPAGSGEEDFECFFFFFFFFFFSYTEFSFPLPMDAPHENFSVISPAVTEMKMLWTTDLPRSRDDLDLN